MYLNFQRTYRKGILSFFSFTAIFTSQANDIDKPINLEAQLLSCDPFKDSKLLSLVIDSDGDGLMDDDEIANGSDPNNACDPLRKPGYALFDLNNPVWRQSDCDGDGIDNITEFSDNNPQTDPYCSGNLSTGGGNFVDTFNVENAENADGLPDGIFTGDLSPNIETITLAYPNLKVGDRICIVLGFNESNGVLAWQLNDTSGEVVNPTSNTSFEAQEICLTVVEAGTQELILNENGPGAIRIDGSTYFSCEQAIDTDGDGILDIVETSNGTDPNDSCDPAQSAGYVNFDSDNDLWKNSDCDDDGVVNIDEFLNGTDPYAISADTDGDGIADDKEIVNGTDQNNPCDPIQNQNYTSFDGINNLWRANDCDDDGILNGDEFDNGTNPYFASGDTDGDGITDDMEIDIASELNNPCDPAQESGYILFNANNDIWSGADCDGDGFLNEEEINAGTDPYTFNSTENTTDSDGDGITDDQETIDETDPNNSCDSLGGTPSATDDCDGDGLTNTEEAIGIDDPSTPADPNGQITDPDNPDTDGDTVFDGQESLDGTDPNDACDSIGGNPPENFDCGALSVASDLIIPNSNNGILRINNIERFADNTVSIFNRWGVKVFEEQGYDNRNIVFNGISSARATIQPLKELPVGVYFYVIKYDDNGTSETLQGYLYLTR